MFRQLIETVVVAPLRSRDKPAGRDRATGAGFMWNFTPTVSDLATRCVEKSFLAASEFEDGTKRCLCEGEQGNGLKWLLGLHSGLVVL
jgi:hypothetical protein